MNSPPIVGEVLARSRGSFRATLGALCLVLGLALGPPRLAFASGSPTGTADLDLQVTFNGVLSVTVDGLSYSTRTLIAGANALVVPSSATVDNSGSLIETWELSVSSVSGGADWAVQNTTATPPDVDEYAFQALFISSATNSINQPLGWSNGCPANTDSDWNSYASIVTSTTSLYNSALYSDPTAIGGANGNPDFSSGIQNGDMSPIALGSGLGNRGLCARLYMPSGTAFVGTPQIIRLTVTAAPGN